MAYPTSASTPLPTQLVLSWAPQALPANQILPLQAQTTALAALAQVAQVGRGGLYLYGPTGVGKSHLLRLWAAQTGAQPCLTAGAAHLWVDDVENLDTAAQEALFHTLTRLESGEVLTFVATGTLPPAQLGRCGVWPEIVSRLATWQVVEVPEPTDADRRQLCLAWAAQQQLTLAPEVLDYLVSHGARQAQRLWQLLTTINGLALAEKRRITIPLIKAVLEAPDAV